MSQFYNDSIFWVEVEKITPNPYQPRREFDETQLRSLADSIRQYGVLQALVVTRKEVPKEDGGLAVEYELIAGERRLRASKLAGLSQVPVLIKVGEDITDLMKLELAIIENIQREDLNPVDRAQAFQRLVADFGFKHIEIGQKVGKSREYVSNSLRLLALPNDILDAISMGKISEGHARPLMMLGDRPEEQGTLFKEIMFKKLTVREAESIGRRIAYDKIRKKGAVLDPETQEMEEKLTETLGTRVSIERRENGGKILIDYFSNEDLHSILELLKSNQVKSPTEMMDKHIIANPIPPVNENIPDYVRDPKIAEMTIEDLHNLDDRTPEEVRKDDNTEEEIYSIKNFSI
ncbi:MAG: ParB/RepB/Spo0J family partition protein [Candidatus Zambryskibacteria bacterium]|nr:ParB/RepB/Spo0J family partition protein [Candidatus Zambryskibacteria bacterium]